MAKRLMDVFCASAGVLLLAPVFIVISVIILMDSRGGIFYLQDRVGKNGKIFKLFKFRTMHVNADRFTAITVGARDPRITSAGYWLRKYKLDELPQLINVVKGEMSLVGPRPEVKKFVDLYNDEQRKVFQIKPGITDLASIHFRNENELLEGKDDPVDFYIREIMPAKLQLNLEYIQRQSFWFDVKIIFRTVFSILKRSKT
jgi:lipopolysaccharide/colanic/teichoic acid biosynthesis glycosyltransferase